MAPNYVERVALAGAFFFGLQLWEGFRAQRSRDAFFAERAAGGSLPTLSWDAAVTERRKVVGMASPLLSVDNFSSENLEVSGLPFSALSGAVPRVQNPPPPPPSSSQGVRCPPNGAALA